MARTYQTIGPEIRGRVPAPLLEDLRRRAQENERSIARELSRAIRVYLAEYDRSDEILRRSRASASITETLGARAADADPEKTSGAGGGLDGD